MTFDFTDLPPVPPRPQRFHFQNIRNKSPLPCPSWEEWEAHIRAYHTPALLAGTLTQDDVNNILDRARNKPHRLAELSAKGHDVKICDCLACRHYQGRIIHRGHKACRRPLHVAGARYAYWHPQLLRLRVIRAANIQNASINSVAIEALEAFLRVLEHQFRLPPIVPVVGPDGKLEDPLGGRA